MRRDTERDDKLGYTHDFETMSETTAYRNHIKNSEIETREVFGTGEPCKLPRPREPKVQNSRAPAH